MKNLRFYYIFAFCILNFAFASIIFAEDIVHLKNGSTIEGEVLKDKDGKPIVKDGKITVEIKGGTVAISLNDIENGIKGVKKIEKKYHTPSEKPEEKPKKKTKPKITVSKPPEKTNPSKTKPNDLTKPKNAKPEGIDARINDIKQRLKDESFKIRLEAIDELIKIKDGAIYPVLVDALKNDCFEVGLKASLYLQKLYKKRKITDDELRTLVDVFSSSTRFSRLRLIMIIGATKHSIASRLLSDAYMREKDIKVKISIIRALGSLNNKEAAKIVRSKLASPEPKIRMTCAIVLGQLGGKESIPLLIERLKDKDRRVLIEASASLRKITKRDFGKNYNLWKCWWLQNQEEKLK